MNIGVNNQTAIAFYYLYHESWCKNVFEVIEVIKAKHSGDKWYIDLLII